MGGEIIQWTKHNQPLKRQAMIYQTLHRNQNIEQHTPGVG
jgi:hypothetical protein